MALPSLKNINWVTTDCYGTLIDWEKGIIDACKKEAQKDGFSFEEEPFLARFMEVQAEIMAGSYELYAEVLRRTIVKVAGPRRRAPAPHDRQSRRRAGLGDRA